MTKPASSFVPVGVGFILLSAALGAAYTTWQRHAQAINDARLAADEKTLPAAARRVAEKRSAADSAAQIEGMSEAAENDVIERTDFYFHHGDYPRVIALDRIITEIDPGDVDAYSTGGWLMESDGDMADAAAYYTLGLTRNPTSSFAAYSLAMFYYNTMRDYPKAEAVLSRSIHFADADPNDWKMLAHTYERENRYGKAVETWKAVIRIFPTAPAAQANLQHDEAVLAGRAAGFQSTPPAAGRLAAPAAPSDAQSTVPAGSKAQRPAFQSPAPYVDSTATPEPTPSSPR